MHHHGDPEQRVDRQDDGAVKDRPVTLWNAPLKESAASAPGWSRTIVTHSLMADREPGGERRHEGQVERST
jgi:hypothetical protein